jgi:hypothetical protein
MSQSYAKSKSGGIRPYRLHTEIEADSGIAPTCESVTEDAPGSDGFAVIFDAALSAGEETVLDTLITNHNAVMPNYGTLVETSIVDGTEALSGSSWVDLGGVVAKLDFLAPLAKILGQINCCVEATGAGAELRIVERLGTDLSDEVVLAGPQAIADSSGAWGIFVLNTGTVPRAGRNEYVLQGRLNGATSASLRSAVLIVLENLG